MDRWIGWEEIMETPGVLDFFDSNSLEWRRLILFMKQDMVIMKAPGS